MSLVVVGGAPYASEYILRVRRAADPRVIFPGYVFGRGYWELQRNAYLFCAPTEVGGTHPVILEALVAGNCVLVNDYEPNAETVGEAGVYFSGTRGRAGPGAPARAPDRPARSEVEAYRERARERAKQYSWDAVATAYEQLLLDVGEGTGPRPAAARPARRDRARDRRGAQRLTRTRAARVRTVPSPVSKPIRNAPGAARRAARHDEAGPRSCSRGARPSASVAALRA